MNMMNMAAIMVSSSTIMRNAARGHRNVNEAKSAELEKQKEKAANVSKCVNDEDETDYLVAVQEESKKDK